LRRCWVSKSFDPARPSGRIFREATRSRSDAEFISKVEGALQELEETASWLELLAEGEVINSTRLGDLMEEADQLIAILVTRPKREIKTRITFAF
jgi:four helix bundle protein